MKQCASLVRWASSCLLRREWEQLRLVVHGLVAASAADPANEPPWIVQAFLISGEDHRFFRHGGIDVLAVCRAVWRGKVLGRREGASTIEMQLVRVLTGRFEPTFARKIREAGLATLLAASVAKSQLPALYLRVGYYGTNMTGYASACLRLGFDPRNLTSREAATLVARLKYPEPATRSERVSKLISLRTAHLLRLHADHLGTVTYCSLPGGVE